jgi:hypothetical protein
MSAVLIWVIVIVAVVALAAALTLVMRAGREPAAKNPNLERRRGQVWGGTHVGGGRSVAPRRDAEVTGDEAPDEPTVQVHKPSGPMDL